ncbi:MAG: hypothetical protein SNJ29_09865 [Rikenellaceae bacterium]
MKKENTAAIIYSCSQDPEKVISNRPKLQRRLQRAIEDMVEDGYINFILPLDERSPFPATAIEAIRAERLLNPRIRLILMLPYEIEEHFDKSPAERLKAYTKYSDEIIYNQSHYVCGSPTNQTENLFSFASATILYFERNCNSLSSVIHKINTERLPYININL